MKLLYLHIDNFGKLSDFDCYFQEGMNTICTENGAGKTTLGAFIKVMFYGFANETKRKDDKERNHYRPWQGGAYGGFIIFEENGKTYELTRNFGEKPSDDINELKDAVTLLPSTDYDPVNLGKQLFQIDAGSFARTAFISQNEYDYGNLTDIDAKIGNLIEEDDDMNHYAQAEQRLSDAISSLSNKRGTGSLNLLNEQIGTVKREILNKPFLENSIAEKNALLKEKRATVDAMADEQAEIDDRINSESAAKDQAVLKTEHDALKANVRQFAKACAQESMHYPYGIPHVDEVSDRINDANSLSVYEANRNGLALRDDEQTLYDELKESCQNRSYVPEAFAQMEEKIRTLNETRERLKEIDLSKEDRQFLKEEEKRLSKFDEKEAQRILNTWTNEREKLQKNIVELRLSREDEQTYRELKQFFEETKPDFSVLETLYRKWTVEREAWKKELNGFTMSDAEEEEFKNLYLFFGEKPLNTKRLKRLLKAWSARGSIQEKISSAEVEIESIKRQVSDVKHRRRMLLWAGLTFTVIGILLGLFLPIHIIGVLIAVAGVGLVLFTLGSSFETLLAGMNRRIATLNQTIRSSKEELNGMEAFTAKFLEAYNVPLDPANAVIQLNNLKAHYDRYTDLYQGAMNNQQKQTGVAEQLRKFDAVCEKVFRTYGLPFNEARFTQTIEDVFMDEKRYQELRERKRVSSEKTATIRARLNEIEQETFDYLRSYSIQPVEELVQENIWELQSRYKSYKELKAYVNTGELKKLTDTRRRLKEEVEEFLKWYTGKIETEEEYYYVLKQVQSDLVDFEELKKKKDAFDQADKQYNDLKNTLASYLRGYGITPQEGNLLEQLEEMRSHALVYQTHMEHYESAFQALKQFERTHSELEQNESVSANNESLLEMNRQRQERADAIQTMKEEIFALQNEIVHLNEEYNALLDQEGELQNMKKDAEAQEEKLSIYRKALVHLRQARVSLNARYAAPLRASLKEYFAILGKYSGFEIDVNANKEVLLKAEGANRDVSSLSEGYQDIVDLCLRIALIDAMYTDVKPLIILDDPFINLDSRGIEAGLSLLGDISSKYQILYMTCHDSRVLQEEMQIPFSELQGKESE